MGRGLIVATLAVLGLLCAAGMGYAAYVVSRGSVAVPVTRLERAPQDLTPTRVRAKAKPKPARTATTTTATTQTVAPPPPPPPSTTTVDDHGSGPRGRDHGEDD